MAEFELDCDIAIIGAGIAGASVAAFLGAGLRAVLIEAEDQPGYHTTGRSAAFYSETYGGPLVQPLTTASGPFLASPPAGFADAPLLRPRGALHVALAGQEAVLDRLAAEFAGSGVRLERLEPASILARAPMLRGEWAGAGLWEPDCRDIDVAALHGGLLRQARANGTRLLTGARVEAAERRGGSWHLATAGGGRVRAAILVNAAGAWADAVAALAGAAPLNVAPLRRTIAQVAVEPPPPHDLPLVLDAAGSWYFRPEAGRLWVSPHDEIPDVARDARPEEIDVATAIDRLERATTLRITRLESAWAGLRCFAPDRLPVLGWDQQVEGFFWCAGQGGFGIQTAPAAGQLCAALLAGRDVPEGLAAAGVRAGTYAPARFATAAGAAGASAAGAAGAAPSGDPGAPSPAASPSPAPASA
ncbi:MAG: NAD(P)/FAD-dependent oxidoreductase [Sphingomonadaceae bacterium]